MNPLKKKLRDSVQGSVRDSVGGSVWAPVGLSVWDSVVRPAGWPLREHLREKYR